MLLVYVDDILMISHDPRPTLEKIGMFYEIKGGKMEPPDTYLGAQIEKKTLKDGSQAWSMSCEKYTKNAVNIVEEMLKREGYHLKTTAKDPFPGGRNL